MTASSHAKARPWRRVYKFDLLLDVLVLVCIAGIIAQRALRSVPELFPGGALIGDLLAALALSYTGAWFFNLLVIRLPKRRAKAAFVEVSGNLVARFSSTALGILQAMATEHGAPLPTRQPDPAYLHELMLTVNPMADAPMIGFDGQRCNWIQYTAHEIERAAGVQQRLVPFFPQMEAETVAAIAAVENCTLFQTIKQLLAAGPMRNSDMTAFESIYLDLWTGCAKVGDRYLDEIAPLLESDRRMHIDQLDGSPPPPNSGSSRRWLRKPSR
ncbi:MAG: hypothetical protein JWO67_1531 [Streptosporangiaceae bacterium]|nr:hypothetical protein [Streptosporangiaceae bacterium]